MAATNLEFKICSGAEALSWNNFISTSPYGDLLQYWQWGESKKSEGWTPYRVAVLKDGQIILAAQCLLKRASFLGNYLYIPHGPVFKIKAELNDALEVLLHGLKQLALSHNCFAIEIEPKIAQIIDELSHFTQLQHFTDPTLIDLFKKAGFVVTGRNMQPKYKLLYDLTLSEVELMMLMKKNTRYNIRLAERKGVVIKSYLATDQQIGPKLKQFYELLKQTQQRAKGYPVRPLSSFIALFEQFKATDCLVLYEASYNGEVIAYNITERTAFWSSSFYAASNRLHPEVKAMYLLRWKSILDCKEYGCKVYDFWGIIPSSTQHAGYSETKLSFGGARLDNYGILSLPLHSGKYLIWDKLLPLRAKIAQLFRR